MISLPLPVKPVEVESSSVAIGLLRCVVDYSKKTVPGTLDWF